GHAERPYAQADHLREALRAARAVDAGAIAASAGKNIPGAIHAARVAAVKHALQGRRQEA
ncbi:MAG: hypothetical protein FD158_1850, partial [bacterium]